MCGGVRHTDGTVVHDCFVPAKCGGRGVWGQMCTDAMAYMQCTCVNADRKHMCASSAAACAFRWFVHFCIPARQIIDLNNCVCGMYLHLCMRIYIYVWDCGNVLCMYYTILNARNITASECFPFLPVTLTVMKHQNCTNTNDRPTRN